MFFHFSLVGIYLPNISVFVQNKNKFSGGMYIDLF